MKAQPILAAHSGAEIFPCKKPPPGGGTKTKLSYKDFDNGVKKLANGFVAGATVIFSSAEGKSKLANQKRG